MYLHTSEWYWYIVMEQETNEIRLRRTFYNKNIINNKNIHQPTRPRTDFRAVGIRAARVRPPTIVIIIIKTTIRTLYSYETKNNIIRYNYNMIMILLRRLPLLSTYITHTHERVRTHMSSIRSHARTHAHGVQQQRTYQRVTIITISCLSLCRLRRCVL